MKQSNLFFKALLLVLLLPVALSVQAQTQFWAGGIHYEMNYSGSIPCVKVIKATATSYSGEITIPTTVDVSTYSMYGERYKEKYVVNAIADEAFRGCTGLTSIVLPNTIESIGKNAFYGCTGLTSVNIPSCVRTINESAFANCTSLTTIALPSSVNSLGWNVFYGCSGLTSVTLSPNTLELNGTFFGCTSLTSVTIPEGVTKLDGTFNGCTALSSVSIPATVIGIGEKAFADCSALTSVYLSNSITYIDKMAFYNTGLTSLELPATVSSIGQNAFDGCTALTTITSRRISSPPYMSNMEGFTSETYGLAALRVPQVSLSAYQSTNWWNQFQNITGDTSLDQVYDFEANGIYYLITGNNTVDVTYKDSNYNSYSGVVNVPYSVTYNGVDYTVTGIGNNAFRNCSNLTRVSMPTSISRIGANAFYYAGLTSLSIPTAVTIIGEKAFYHCSQLTSLNIPVNVTSIGNRAFEGCYGVTSLSWNARECWTNGAMHTQDISQVSIGGSVKVLPSSFLYGSQISNVYMPSSVEYIGSHAFCGCHNLTSVSIPVNVRYIGASAFGDIDGITDLDWYARECWSIGSMQTSNLVNVYIGDEVQVIPDGFASRSSITSVSLPPSVKYIGNDAFYVCSGLRSLEIPDSVVMIGNRAFYDTHVRWLTVGKGLESVGTRGLEIYYTELTSISWHARRCISSGMLPFSYVNQLEIGDEVEWIPDNFGQNLYMSSLTLPQSVTQIGNYAFSGMYSLTTLNLPDGLTKIGEYAFAWNEKLASLTLPPSLDTIGSQAFNRCIKLPGLTFPASVTSIGKYAFSQCSGLEYLVVDEDNPVYDSRENCNAVFKTANDSLVLVCKNTVLPSTITEIPDSAFMNHSELTNIEIPASVTRIGKDAFRGCTNLTSITIPAATTEIDERAFYNCPGLESIIVEEGNTVYDSRDNCNALIETATNTLIAGCPNTIIPNTVTTIGQGAFFACSTMTTIDIPEGVECIMGSAFSDCSALTSVTIPASVKTIGDMAFYGCWALSMVNTPDLAAWCNIDFNDYYSNPLYFAHHLMVNGNEVISLEIPSTVTELKDYTFCNFNAMADVTIPMSVKRIGSYTFYSCTGLSNLTIPVGVETIGSYAFYNCTGLTSLTLGSALRSIGTYAFYYCRNIQSLVIPSKVETIGNYAFCDCSGLKDLTLGSSVRTIGSAAFRGCSGLTGLAVPNSVEVIDESAFAYCSGLKRVVFGNSMRRIGNYAFYNCSAITSVISGAATPPAIEYLTISSCYNKATLYVPEASLDAYKTANYWKQFHEILGVPGSGPGDIDADGEIAIGDVSDLVSAILEDDPNVINNPFADVNADGVVDISDIADLITILLEM